MTRQPQGARGRVERAVLAQLKHLEKHHARAALVVACSGGADSLALADAIIRLAPSREFKPVAVTVDHGWRAESGAQARKVQEILTGLGYSQVELLTLPDAQIAGKGKEGDARKRRYQALEEAASRYGSLGENV